ncbi:MAG: polyhydroxyalkanoate synthesis repressor PhaR [Alphaproteobacteria bacterium]
MAEPVIIKKYANRRLYNTETSTYITLEELGHLVRENRDFEVVDAKTGEDLTRSVLAQILFEEEAKGAAMLPVRFLRQLISYYDNNMQTVMPHYLEMVMDVFMKNQQTIQERTNGMLGTFSPFASMQNVQEMQRRNMENFQNMMGMFNPFFQQQKPAAPTPAADDKDAVIAALKQQLAELQEKAKRK